MTFLNPHTRRDFCKYALATALCAPFAQAASPSTRPATKPSKKKPDLDEAFFTNGHLPRIQIETSKAELARLDRDPKTFVRCLITETAPEIAEKTYPDVGIHLKGGPGSFRRTGEKPALTLNFDKFVDGQDYHGLDKIHLNNSVQDGTFLYEAICSWLSRQAGVPSPRVSWARVTLNNRDWGFYVLKEGFDGPFLKQFFKNKDGVIYEGSFRDIDSDMPYRAGAGRKDAAKPADQHKKIMARLKELVDAAREIDYARRMARLNELLDINQFISFMAVESITCHWDGYIGNRNNYRIYDDPKTGKFIFMTHGMDQMFQRPDQPLLLPGALLGGAILASQDGRDRFYDRVAQLHKTCFSPEAILTELDAISKRSAPLFEAEGKHQIQEHKNRLNQARTAIAARIKNIDFQLNNRPKPLSFDSSGLATVSGWTPAANVNQGNVTTEEIKENGKPRLKVTCKAPGGMVSWRTTVMLNQGRYSFVGQVMTSGVKPAAGVEMPGAGLRISGAKERSKLDGTSPWTAMTFDFEVTDPSREVVLVCELRAESGSAMFDPATLKLKKR